MKLPQNNRSFLLVACLLFVCTLGLGTWVSITNKTDDTNVPSGYRKLENYNHPDPDGATCLALTPSCGYCPGDVIDEACYVDQATYENYRTEYTE